MPLDATRNFMPLAAVITAAAPNQRHLLHQTIARSEGRLETLGDFALEMLLPKGRAPLVDRVAIVIANGEGPRFEGLANGHRPRVTLIEQAGPPGYLPAILAAREFVGEDPFLHLVGDHFYLAEAGPSSSLIEQMVESFAQEGSSISAVQPTRESLLPYFGAVAGTPKPASRPLYVVDTVLEKPTPTEAEQRLIVPGLRAGHYLCFFGIHIFTPSFYRFLDEVVRKQACPPSLSAALDQFARRERLLATILPGTRFDLGNRYGILQAQLALALQGPDRDEILTMILELLAR